MTAVVLGQQGSEAVSTGSNPSLYLIFFNLINTTENRDNPLLCMKNFDTRIFPKPGRVTLQNFSVLKQKFFDGESRYPPPLCIKNFDTRVFLKRRRVPLRFFWYCETKNFPQKIVIYPSYAQNFSIPEISETLKGSPTKNFGTVSVAAHLRGMRPIPSTKKDTLMLRENSNSN